jgi:hypothetical protein
VKSTDVFLKPNLKSMLLLMILMPFAPVTFKAFEIGRSQLVASRQVRASFNVLCERILDK